MSWDWAYAISILPLLAKAAIVTVQAALGGFAIALVLGLILALLRRSHVRAISWPVGAAVEFIRSTPLLIQLFFLYFGLPQFGIRPTPLAVGVIAFGVHFSTYLSEVFRAGLDAVSRGQWDAATALNFKRFDRMVRIILPQAVPPMVPVLGNYLVLMLKDTPVLAAISVLELLQTARALASQSFRYLEPLTLVGLFFLTLSVIAGFAIQALEARLTRKRS